MTPAPSPSRRLKLFLAAETVALVVLAGLYFFNRPSKPAAAVSPTPTPQVESQPTVGRAAEAHARFPASLQSLVDDLAARFTDELHLRWREAIITAWTDLPAAFAILDRIFPASDVDEKKAELLRLVAGERLELLPPGLNLIHDRRARSGAASGVISAWAGKEPLKLAAFAATRPASEFKSNALQAAVEALARTRRFSDAQTVLALLPASHARRMAIDKIAHAWGRDDLAGALAWAEQLPEVDEQRTARRAIIGEASARLSLAELENLAAQADAETRSLWITAIGRKRIDSDVEGAQRWMETLSPEQKQNLQPHLAAKLAERDLATGTAYALRLDADNRTQALDDIQRTLNDREVVETISWMNSLPIAEQERVAFTLVTTWFALDSVAAENWARQLPEGSVRDRALVALTAQLQDTDLEAAQEAAELIGDDETRAVMLGELETAR